MEIAVVGFQSHQVNDQLQSFGEISGVCAGTRGYHEREVVGHEQRSRVSVDAIAKDLPA